ncbi:MAG: 4Fe-4S dicluster domain-containing protein [Saprospiraceae bacterium]|nr:4Fe-4S dicluster domain-containing protein [Saprospiraceae bacterium]
MKHNESNIWVGEKDLLRDESFISEIQSEISMEASTSVVEDDRMGALEANRRDFLKMLGFGIGAATLASCEIPVKKAIPYVIKPDTIVPGIANYYASSFVNGGDYCSVLIKTREGRPIKIEGNASSGITRGGTSARVQASVLSLYDYNRIQGPGMLKDGMPELTDWVSFDKEITGQINSGSKIRIVSSTIMSPSALKAVSEFTAKFPNTKHIMYDAVSSAALLDASKVCFGERVVPDYKFDQAELIVSFNADFLGTWISPIEYAAQYASKRTLKKDNYRMNRHVQIESHLSLTGSNADNRILVKPSEQSAAIAHLYNEIAGKSGRAVQTAPSLNDRAKQAISKLAEQLLANKSASLVVCGNNNLGDQILTFAINDMLGNINKTVRFERCSLQRKGSDQDVQQLIADMKSGNVDALIVWNANPCYDLPNAAEFAEGMSKVGLSISMNATVDETTHACKYVAPEHHYLESWGDVEAKSGQFSFIQPAIHPIFKTRHAGESFLNWCDSSNLNKQSEQAYYEYVMKNWADKTGSASQNFQTAWDKMLHDGVYEVATNERLLVCNADVNLAFSKLTKPSESALEISFYESVSLGSGAYATNPWLQELPDPVMRTVWGNYLAVPLTFDGDRRFQAMNQVKEDGEELELTVGENKFKVAAVKQFGQMQGTVAIALGYGRQHAGDCGSGVGTDFNALCSLADGYVQYFHTSVSMSESSKTIEKNFACVQHHHTFGVTAVETSSGKVINADEAALVDDAFKGLTKGYQGSLTDRSIIRHSNVKDVKENIEKLQKEREHHQHLNSHTLYPGHDYKYNAGHHWGMHIDLNACIGCGACAVACMAENNVPVVGKKEVSRHHEMTWIRIDRYYYGHVESPNVVYQPMMCQHCNNAPCENVCPVNATNHSSEGLNQMAYNRCVGTRYCANNCPYKVRRFNWYDYTTADLFPVNQYNLANEKNQPFYSDNLVRMVLNPDVTVRSRGVIEKCSFCVQRIQEGKLNAKKEQRTLRDQDVKTACQTSCPTGAITFGDMNNQDGELHQKLQNPLNYIVLEEINVKSVVNYTMKVNNRDETLDA